MTELEEKIAEKGSDLGDCFHWAGLKLMEDGFKDATLVHAIVTNPDTGKTFGHGWLEKDGKVFDELNFSMYPEGIDEQTFYDFFNPENIKKYSGLEGLTNVMETKNFGPWHFDEKGLTDDLYKN